MGIDRRLYCYADASCDRQISQTLSAQNQRRHPHRQQLCRSRSCQGYLLTMRSAIAVLRLGLFFLSGVFTVIYQKIVLSFTTGPMAFAYPRAYHKFCAWLMGMKVIVEGEPMATGQNVIYVGNHISYMDICTIGSVIPAAFVAKKDIENWPFFGIVGKAGRTLYISRNPAEAAEAAKRLEDRLNEPSPLIFFAEGTSSNGKQIIPFRSSAFEIFLKHKTIIQPFTLSLMELDKETNITDALRDQYTWYGDMDLMPHLWNFAKMKGGVIKLTFQKPFLSHSFQNRKELCNACYEDVVKGLDLSPSPEYVLPETQKQHATF
ncbi:MAG: hypothetical protein DI551_09740 [Micavibrio aeruginosavorus]|uniref:Phospholipid/glycerol acyltransferase domain-containing protein n=1 Tax=Micavibrio aeruginosavorus TaxID=349221 RepID=A0A2W5PQ44_9BACT|nr:MAG: hypothetical protein DI551_09740 [Micavibrio aeruginosavorus]